MTLIEPGHWKIDRRIALPTIFALFFQTVTLVAIGSWYASAYDSRISANEGSITRMEARVAVAENNVAASVATMARIDERLKATNETMAEIKALLQALQNDRRRLVK